MSAQLDLAENVDTVRDLPLLARALQLSGEYSPSGEVTAEMAREWLDKYRYDAQRNVRPSHITYLSAAIRKGDFWPDTQLRFTLDKKGALLLVDGYHRLETLVATGHSARFVITISPVSNARDAAHIYGSIDRGKARTDVDFLKAHNVDAGNLSNTQIRQVFAALRSVYAGMPYTKTTIALALPREAILAAMPQWMPAAQVYFEACTGAPQHLQRNLQRIPVVAMGLLTCRYGIKPAAEFWGEMAQDIIVTPDPRRALINWWINRDSMSGGRVGQAGYAASNVAYYNRESALNVAAVWGHWHRGGTLKKIQTRKLDNPIVLRGIPYHSEQQKAWMGEWLKNTDAALRLVP